jgi:hypothetical protein
MSIWTQLFRGQGHAGHASRGCCGGGHSHAQDDRYDAAHAHHPGEVAPDGAPQDEPRPVGAAGPDHEHGRPSSPDLQGGV